MTVSPIHVDYEEDWWQHIPLSESNINGERLWLNTPTRTQTSDLKWICNVEKDVTSVEKFWNEIETQDQFCPKKVTTKNKTEVCAIATDTYWNKMDFAGRRLKRMRLWSDTAIELDWNLQD